MIDSEEIKRDNTSVILYSNSIGAMEIWTIWKVNSIVTKFHKKTIAIF